MNLKDQQQQIEQTRQRIWLQTQYLTTLAEQEAGIFAATPETKKRTANRIAAARALLDQEAGRLAQQTDGLIASIKAIGDSRIQEIMTRRYLKEQPFNEIAAAMDYDLRWVYRLHHQGLALTEDSR